MVDQIDKWRARDCLKYKQSKKIIKPQYALQRLNSLTKNLSPFITTEVGQHQMWAAQFIEFNKPKHWMTSGGLEQWVMDFQQLSAYRLLIQRFSC